ncbi:hypothetical protein FRB90_004989 [Tulasnella sp. 427]|nr:hypothetical protein FRB90_004989 [Tulasnella sp. 427]
MNILVNDSFDAVITDFGSARLVDKPQPSGTLGEEATDAQQVLRLQVKFRAHTNELTLTGAKISLRWAAPEVLDEATTDLPSDMWAFGWICWEFITGKIPFPDEKNAWAIIPRVVRHQMPALRDDAQLSYVISLCSVMTDCWSLDVTRRPSARQCEKELYWIPDAVPSVPSSGGIKDRSPQHLNSLAAIYMFQSEYQAVETLLNEALTLARLASDYYSECMVLDSLRSYHTLRGNLREAKQSTSLLAGISAQHGFKTVENWMPAMEGILSFGLQDLGKPEELLDQTQPALDALDGILRAENLVARACAYLTQSNFDLAKESLTQALEVFTSEGCFHNAGLILNTMALIHGAQGMAESMDGLLQRSAEIATRMSGGQYIQAHSLLITGTFRAIQKKYSEAEEDLNAANEICSILGVGTGQVAASALLGDIHHARDNYSKATESYIQALNIAAQIGSPALESIPLISLGEVLDKQSKPSEAEEAFSKALVASKQIGSYASRASAMSRLGHIFYSREELKKQKLHFLTQLAHTDVRETS